jgi:hypothetical protein
MAEQMASNPALQVADTCLARMKLWASFGSCLTVT